MGFTESCLALGNMHLSGVGESVHQIFHISNGVSRTLCDSRAKLLIFQTVMTAACLTIPPKNWDSLLAPILSEITRGCFLHHEAWQVLASFCIWFLSFVTCDEAPPPLQPENEDPPSQPGSEGLPPLWPGNKALICLQPENKVPPPLWLGNEAKLAPEWLLLDCKVPYTELSILITAVNSAVHIYH